MFIEVWPVQNIVPSAMVASEARAALNNDRYGQGYGFGQGC